MVSQQFLIDITAPLQKLNVILVVHVVRRVHLSNRIELSKILLVLRVVSDGLQLDFFHLEDYVVAGLLVGFLQGQEFVLDLRRVRFHVFKQLLIDGVSFFYLVDAFGQQPLLVLNFFGVSLSGSVYLSNFFVDLLKNV